MSGRNVVILDGSKKKNPPACDAGGLPQDQYGDWRHRRTWSKSDVDNVTTRADENQALCEKMASPFAQAHEAFVAAGYCPLPIMPGEKKPGTVGFGGWHELTGWPLVAQKPDWPEQRASWARMSSETGVGIALGTMSDGYQLIAVDFDTDDFDELQRLQSQIPTSPMRKRGARGYTAFYRAGINVKTKRYMIGQNGNKRCILEILTGNAPRQTVMPPSAHPAGHPYSWSDGGKLVPIGELPVLEAHDFDRLEDTLSGLGWGGAVNVQEDGEKLPSNARKPREDDDRTGYAGLCADINHRAMDCFSLWVPYLGEIHNLRPHAGGYEGTATWRASNSGRPLDQRKRNLKIHPRGIVDFGTDEGFTPIDLVMRATGRDLDSACEFLGDKTGLYAETNAKFEAFDAFLAERRKLARLSEYDEQMKMAAVSYSVVEGLPRANDDLPPHDPETGEIYEAFDPSGRELPAHLCRPLGLFGRIVEWVYSTAGNPNRALALATGVAVMAVLIGKGRSTPIRAGGVHLYTLVIGPTACGKGHTLKCARKLITAASAPSTPFQPALELLGDDDWMSQSALLNQLVAKPVSLSLTDEIGAFLSTAMARNAGAHLTNLLKTVRTAWSCSLDDSFTTPGWANKKATVVSPCFNVLGATTAPEFFAALSSKETVNGVLNRFLAIQTWEKGSSLISETDDDEDGELVVPFELADDLIRFARLMRGSQRFIKTPWADGGPRAYNDMVAKIDDMIAKDASLEPYLGRCAEMAMKLATISAVGRDPFSPAVTVEDVKFGQGIAEWSLLAMAEGAGDYIGDSQVEKDRNAIIRALKAAKGGVMTRSQLLRRGLSAKCVMETTRELKEMGVIAISETSQAKGPVAKTYRLLAQSRRN